MQDAGPGSSGAGFGRDRRLRRRAEFDRVFRTNVRVRGRLLTMVVGRNGLATSRLGIAASRKLGGAVVRNRAKRMVREVFRRVDVPPGLDVVVIPRVEILDATLGTVAVELREGLRRASRDARLRAGAPSGS